MTKKSIKEKKVSDESFSLLSEFDIHLFKSGKHHRLYEKLGSHIIEYKGDQGTYFAVWAPNATAVSLIGNFNHWNNETHRLHARWDESGIWEGFFPGIGKGEVYKYAIFSTSGEYLEKADPFGIKHEVPPKTASVVWNENYSWKDSAWLEERKNTAANVKPYSVYEVHAGSWRRKTEDGNRSLSYT